MKQKLFAVLLFLFSLSVIANESKTHLVIWTKGGPQVAYALREKPKISFTETNMVIIASDIEINFMLENKVRFTYEDDIKIKN